MLTQVHNLTDFLTEFHALKDQVRVLKHVDYYSQSTIGDYKYSARSNDYHGWLLCDGRSVSKTDVSALYQIVGDVFGSGMSNSSNFYLPDFRGRVLGAAGAGGDLTERFVGTSLGEEEHRLTIPEMPSHTHTGTTSTNGLHNHGGSTGTSINVGNGSVNVTGGLTTEVGDNGNHSHTISQDGNHAHTFTTASTGGDQYHNNMQPTLFGGNTFIFAGLTNYVLSDAAWH